MRRSIWLLALLVAVAAAQESGDFVLRSTTRLVSLDLVAVDKDGVPVRDLQASDFTILDQGNPQAFQLQRSPGQPAAVAPGDTQTGAASRLGLPPQLPANLYTNATAADGAPQSVSVILFDGLNTPVDDQRYAKTQILKLLRQLKPTDRVGLYVLGSSLRVVHDYSSNAESLLKELGLMDDQLIANPRTESSFAPLLNTTKLDMALSDTQEIVSSQIFFDQQIALNRLTVRIQTTFNALEAIAQQLAPVPGRKSLLWVSAAFPMVVGTDIRTGTGSPTTFGRMADRAMRAVANAGVAIYPIDARGLMLDPLYRAKTTYQDYAMAEVIGVSRSRGGRRGGQTALTSPDPMVFGDRNETKSHHDVMVELAKRTGGRASFQTNDVPAMLRQSLDEADHTYTFTWYPAPYEEDGKFRKIQVKVARPGLTIRHRDGYFAAESPKRAKESQREAMLGAMISPMNLGAVPFAVQVEPIDAKLRLTLKFDPAAVTLSEEKGQWLGHLDVVFLYMDATGTRKGGNEVALPLKLSAGNRQEASKNGFYYQASIPQNPEAHQLVIGVRDAPSGRVGTLRIDSSKLPLDAAPAKPAP